MLFNYDHLCEITICYSWALALKLSQEEDKNDE
jgi:hypothetical protein